MTSDLYKTFQDRVNTTAGRNAYWLQLRSAKDEYDGLSQEQRGLDLGHSGLEQDGGFYTWLKFKYGVKIIYTQDGKISADYEVVDQDLYLLFLLKYPV